MNTRAACVAVVLVCSFGFHLGGSTFAAGALGQIVTPGTRVDGALVPSGATLFDPASLVTAEDGAVIHLGSRRTLHLAGHSQAVLRSAPRGGVQVAVLAGALSYLDDDGSLITVGEQGSAVISGPTLAPQATVGSGASLSFDPNKDIDICELLNEEPEEREVCKADPLDDECRWKLIVVDGSEDPADHPDIIQVVEDRLARGDRLREELNEEYDRDCDEGPLILLGAAALSTATVVGIVGGSVLGSVVIGDDLPPASVIQP